MTGRGYTWFGQPAPGQLSIQVFNQPHRLPVRHLLKIILGGSPGGVSENDSVHELNKHAESEGRCGPHGFSDHRASDEFPQFTRCLQMSIPAQFFKMPHPRNLHPTLILPSTVIDLLCDPILQQSLTFSLTENLTSASPILLMICSGAIRF